MQRIIVTLLVNVVALLALNAQSLSVLEGKEGVYVFYSNEILGEGNSREITTAVISKSEAGGNSRELAAVTANYDLNEMKKKFGNDFPSTTAAYLNLNTENDLPAFMRQHPKLDDYGWLVLDMHFMQTAGAVYFDAAKPAAGTKVKYSVQLKNKSGAQIGEALEGEATIGAPLNFSKLTVAAKHENDSLVSVTWKAGKSVQPFFFANVYRLSGDKGNYTQVGKVMANTEGDSTTFQWTEEVLPGGLYKYFLRPTNMVGLEGNPSDTAGVIAADFGKVPRFENFSFTDTAGGIYFSWTPLAANVLYSGIAVLRKPMGDEDFISLDTISFTSSSFFDNHVTPNIVYQYEFRLVNLRWKPLPPSANATAIHRTGSQNLHVPFAIKAEAVKEGIKVTWKAVKHYDVNGYYVYRSVNGDEYKLQSLLLKDTVFVDDDATNGRTLYNYYITTLNFSDVESAPSNTVQAKPFNTIIPIAPNGIFAYMEPGKVNLQWNNMKNNDQLIAGYFVYRKEGSQPFNKIYTPAELQAAGFVKLNNVLVEAPMYADTKVVSGKAYTYAVTSVDANAAESNAEQLVETEAATVRVAAPSYFGLSKKANGVEVSWDADLNSSVTDYAIYRRARNETALQLLTTVRASQLSYTDTRATAGTFYFYAIKAKTASGNESDFSIEKGIMR
ncbi:MAG: hypothetical protein KIS94_14015 [Chitinophagales bacterium]|nr:hypothetical protein [Chitinophagales bacterium]